MKRIYEYLTLTWLAMLVFLSMAMVSSTLDELVRQRFPDIGNAASMFMKVHSMPQLLLVGIIAGFFSDKIRRRYPLILPSLMITGLCTALLPVIDDFNTLLVVRFIDGTSGIIALGLIMTRFLDLASGKSSSGRLLGLFMFSVPLGYLSAMVLTLIMVPFGLKVFFGSTGILIMLSALLMFPLLRKEYSIEEIHGPPIEFFRSIKRAPKLWPALLFSFVDKFTFAGIAMLTSLVLIDVYKVDQVDGSQFASIALAVYFIGFFIFSPVAGIVCERIGPKTVILLSSFLYGIALMTLPNLPLFAFFGVMALAGALTSFQFVPTLGLLGELSEETERGTNTQLFNFTGSLGFILGFSVLGVIITKPNGYVMAYGVAGGLEILAVVICLGFFTLLKVKIPIRKPQDKAEVVPTTPTTPSLAPQ